jgi:hypothetical protein
MLGKISVSPLGKTTESLASSVEPAVPTSAPSVSTSTEPALVHQPCALAHASNFRRQSCVGIYCVWEFSYMLDILDEEIVYCITLQLQLHAVTDIYVFF